MGFWRIVFTIILPPLGVHGFKCYNLLQSFGYLVSDA
ncbi:Uncharacterised protein [Klebsiella pneumoniae]|nr:Uncharacterised protein [Klebsiella pneumoniae]